MLNLFKRLPAWSSAVMLGFALHVPAVADVVTIPGTPTEISGSVERLISYRMQYHMWRTQDGNVHLLANVGPQVGGSLRMYSSLDNGITWTPGLRLPNTGLQSTLDGLLYGDSLYVAYSTSGSGLAFSLLRYSSASRLWSLTATETPFRSDTVAASTPALARDNLGRYWLAFAAADASGNYSIKLLRRSSLAEGWVDTQQVFGPANNKSPALSGRPVTLVDGVGMVYVVDQNVYWARRNDGQAVDAVWPTQLVYASQGVDNDPDGTHYSATVDGSSNVHLATADGGQLIYFRLSNATRTWNTRPVVLTKPVQAAYMQILSAGDNLMVLYNNQASVGVIQSSDNFATWTTTYRLSHQADPNTDFNNPRMVAPANVAGNPVPVLQQFNYVDTGLQGALEFQVPFLAVTPARAP